MSKIYHKKISGCKIKHYLFGLRVWTSWDCDFKEIVNKIISEVQKVSGGKILVVIPSDRLQDYEDRGYFDLAGYYNPNSFFNKVFCLSPLESGISDKHGMTIIGVSPKIYRKVLKVIKPVCVRAYGGYILICVSFLLCL